MRSVTVGVNNAAYAVEIALKSYFIEVQADMPTVPIVGEAVMKQIFL